MNLNTTISLRAWVVVVGKANKYPSSSSSHLFPPYPPQLHDWHHLRLFCCIAFNLCSLPYEGKGLKKLQVLLFACEKSDQILCVEVSFLPGSIVFALLTRLFQLL